MVVIHGGLMTLAWAVLLPAGESPAASEVDHLAA
jgi:hypothetical protein